MLRPALPCPGVLWCALPYSALPYSDALRSALPYGGGMVGPW